MPTVGPRSPATVTTETAGATAWTSPGNAVSSNDVRANAGAFTGNNTDYLQAVGFGFTLPTDAVINGIKVEVERREQGGSAAVVKDLEVRIVKGGTRQGEVNRADTVTSWPAADAYATYGSASDKWGVTWTAADINAATFGAAIRASISGGIGGDFETPEIDHIRISVTHDEVLVAGEGRVNQPTGTELGTWMNDASLATQANRMIPEVIRLVRAYTHGRGFEGPEAGIVKMDTPLYSVVTTITARLLKNPGQVDIRGTEAGTVLTGSFRGYTTFELSVLNQYRKATA